MLDMSANSLPRRPRQEVAAEVMFWLMCCLTAFVVVILFGHAFGEARRQHRVVSTYQPVQATVLSSEVKRWESDHHVAHYDADIRYRFEIKGRTYQSSQLAPLSTYGSEEWANSMVARYKPDHPCEAFYDPADPSQAVLLRRYVFSPYQETLQGAFILTGFCFMLLYLWFAKRPKLTPADNGWFVIAPQSGERQRLLTAKACAAVWYLAGALPAVHYFLCVPPPHSASSLHTFEFFFALGLIPIAFLVYYSRMNRNMNEARVLVDRAEGTLGERLRFSATQTLRQQLQLEHASLRFSCLGIKRQGRASSSTVLFEATLAELKKQTLHAGEDLKLEGDLTLPVKEQPSGRDSSGKYNWIAWHLYLKCSVRHAPDYATEYRLQVNAPLVVPPEPAVKPTGSVDVRVIERPLAGRVMSRSTTIIGSLISFIPNVILLAGCWLMVSVLFVVIPNKDHTRAFWDLPKPQAQQVFCLGAMLAGLSSVWGLAFPGGLRNRYFRALLRREIKQRPDAIVQADADTWFVEIVPRSNWNRMMWRTETDIGFLAVDAVRRELRFEGDKERFCVPVDALLSCEVEKSVFSSSAKPTAPGYFMVTLRASSAGGVWEAPVSPIVGGSIFRSRARQLAAKSLRAKIKALRPVAVTMEKESNHSSPRVTP